MANYYCTSSFKPSIILFLLFFFFIAITSLQAAKDSISTHLHFFLHEKGIRPNATAITVVNSTTSNPNGFGSIGIFDDELRQGSSVDSKLIGRAQGMSSSVSISELAFLVVIDLVFTDGSEFNGSSLMVVGRDVIAGPTELSIIGGTGKFRMARGYTINSLLSGASAEGFIAEYDAYIVLH